MDYALLFVLMSFFHVAEANEKARLAELTVFSQTEQGDPRELLERGRQILSEAKGQHWLIAQARASAFIVYQLMGLQRYDELATHISPALRMASVANDPVSEVIIRASVLRYLHDKNDLTSVDMYRRRISVLLENDLPALHTARAYHALGASSVMLDEYFRALEELERARELFAMLDNQSGGADVLSTIASLHQRLGNHDIALGMYQRLFQRYADQEPSMEQANHAYHIASVSLKLGEYDTAAEYADLTWNISQTLGDNLGLAFAYSLYAEIAFANEQYQEALLYLSNSKETLAQRRIQHYHMTNVAIEAKSLAKLGQFSQAKVLTELLKEYAQKLPAQRLTMGTYWNTLFFVEKAAGRFEPAIDALTQKMALDAEQANRNRIGNINRLLTEFGVREQHARNTLLEEKNKRVELELEVKQRRQWELTMAVITVSVLTIGIAWAWMLQTRRGRQMRSLAMTDPLTQAPNRRAILEIAQHEFERRNPNQKGMSLMLLDIDHFKRINDTFGHHVGDNTLKAFAHACHSSLRQGDYYGRIGGEEWMIVLPDVNKEDITHIFSRIRSQLNAINIDGLPEHYPLTFSMGACLFSRNYTSIQEMMSLADNNVYLAKDSGRDRVVA